MTPHKIVLDEVEREMTQIHKPKFIKERKYEVDIKDFKDRLVNYPESKFVEEDTEVKLL